jgi:glucose/arabinose dehydrogenase
LLGKILRIDPTPAANAPYTIPSGNPFADGGGRPEIWAYGLRNPWRFSFDRSTHDLWIADVGQNLYEEVDFVPAGQGAGANYGWNRVEGNHPFRGTAPANAVAPVLELPHANGYCAVVGGFVYRGTKIPDLRGAYLYSDNCKPNIGAIKVDGGRVVASRDLGVTLRSVSSFGQDADGELYVLSLSQGLYRIDPAA